MEGKTIFPREEKSEILFEKILRDPWACEKLMDTFCNYLFCNDDFDCNLSPEEFTKSLLSAYLDRDMSAFLMSICNNTMFDLLRNSYLIPYRFNADGKTNPVIMTGEHGELLPEFRNSVREKDYQHFHDIYTHMTHNENMYLAKAYRYSHEYTSDNMEVGQKILEECTGVLLIRELPDTVKLKETEAEAYCAVWDIMVELEKNLPMAFVFYGQDTLGKQGMRYDELGIFLPDSLLMKNLERHVAKAEAIIYAEKEECKKRKCRIVHRHYGEKSHGDPMA